MEDHDPTSHGQCRVPTFHIGNPGCRYLQVLYEYVQFQGPRRQCLTIIGLHKLVGPGASQGAPSPPPVSMSCGQKEALVVCGSEIHDVVFMLYEGTKKRHAAQGLCAVVQNKQLCIHPVEHLVISGPLLCR